jgi:hypothetical protein
MIYTVEDMQEEIRAALIQGESMEDIRDQIGEYVDGYMPIYNNEIIQEWQNMPGDYDNRGSAELGHLDHEINIINLMSLDLYIYYSELFHSALDLLVEDILEGESNE